MFSKKTGNKNSQLEIAIELIHPNPDQPRKIFEEQELAELCDSIREFGILQPILLKKEQDQTYLLIAGERRFRAAQIVGLKQVPAVIREVDDREVALIALVENVQRENLNYMEEAQAYQRLMVDHGLTQSEIARRMGKQQSTISNKIRLLALPPDIQKVLAENQLTERHARALLRVHDDQLRMRIVEKILKNGFNVKQTDKLIDDLMQKQEEDLRKRDKLRFISYKIYVNTIRKAFTAVSEVEKEAKYFQEDKGDFLELRILIPKTRNVEPGLTQKNPVSNSQTAMPQ